MFLNISTNLLIDAIVGIFALQATYSLYRPDLVAADSGLLSQLGFFLAVEIGLGILCGIVFLWLVRVRPAGEELVLYLLGICAFAAGAPCSGGSLPCSSRWSWAPWWPTWADEGSASPPS